MKFFSYGSSCEEKTRLRYWFMKLDPAIKRMIIMRINLIAFLVSITVMNVCASASAQSISINVQQAPLKEVLNQIKKQSGYQFLYDKVQIESSKSVTINVKGAELKQVLDLCFDQQPLTYEIVNKTIVIKLKPRSLGDKVTSFLKSLKVTGRVKDEDNKPVAGATVKIKGSKQSGTTNQDGKFSLNDVSEAATLVISFIGYEDQEMPVTAEMTIVLKRSTSRLDEIQVIAYGSVVQRLSTGTVTKIKATDIEKQPISNPLAALQGRVSGLIVAQSSGLSGSSYDVQLRGRTSIKNSSNPLYLIDGVPFGGTSLDIIGGGTGIYGQSPFSSINTQDIESIEVLKDADATAIYGSRGANGVILITTKKGKAGKTEFSANFYSGIGKVTRTMEYLNTAQYLDMRREAFKNDGIVPTASNAPDLMVWDNSRYTDWKDLLIGGTAKTTDVQANLSGGSQTTQFLIGTNYHHETTVFPGSLADNKANVHFNLNHRSTDNKFLFNFSATYNNDNNNLISTDLTSVVRIVPNAPLPFDASGKLNWSEGGVSFQNPLAYFQQPYKAVTDNLMSNAVVEYALFPELKIRTNLGFTNMALKQTILKPKSSADPANTTTNSATFANNTGKNWIIEPQLEYEKSFALHKINVLVGSTWQQDIIDGKKIDASGFISDALIESPGAAASQVTRLNYSQYNYQAVFGRINYNYDNKYIVNLTGRRDGSSRFGPGKQFANFGSIGAAWIFTEEAWTKRLLPYLSFGKLRSSFGVTGNDKIGDYKFLDTWLTSNYPYQGTAGLTPYFLNNPDYAWELNKKLEFSIDLGFFKDKILFNAGFYQNRSSNQLIDYSLPAQTGFTQILKNFPALVQNAGWEFNLNTTNINNQKFNWTSNLNLTIARNKLLEFPGLETSSYADQYMIGYPLAITKNLIYKGVDPQTGVYTFNGTNIVSDRTSIGNIEPKFYGGLSNSFSYQGFQLDFLLQFVKQDGLNYLASSSVVTPGIMNNQPIYVLDRWTAPGQSTTVQKFTTQNTTGAAGTANYNYTFYSDARISDASFIRLKNVYLGYSIPGTWINRIKAKSLKVYLQAQNLFTVTNYFGNDPENANYNALPPLRVITAGLQFSY
ncbi:SusC/RagA family TonB-linked outer membrane protein [Pedobacter sp. MC2016-24]|uniref:SusC/RagA family TonB-linked outer membrane protein n=1 Tax=Pedobacter sp. MC2016-24 TaxID=2780090 RepID=UPI0018802972|nr:SusC/RagA family TonB-linked outer membrane protein [Pedobacter sp. MC2016-24]MBE9598672.1 SusC/RagA family TonB-linked outer membrane protein [Pedobacter sp. MC2016-24]